MALEETQRLARTVNENRRAEDKPTFKFGVGITVGEVMYGNIGVSDRLAFTVIGPVVNRVERIEKLTKKVEAFALVTKEIAEHSPDKWISAGKHALAGFAHDCEVFQLAQSKVS